LRVTLPPLPRPRGWMTKRSNRWGWRDRPRTREIGLIGNGAVRSRDGTL
jgi:hypothetical protein